ncbi:MAG: hypothetical protein IT449_13065 [Phycisphaerales bacterium]|nr:hypothetical protein [Phycisphaerales bacterium]
MTEWLGVFGRLHPLVLHLPIGVLTGCALLELVNLLRRRIGGPETAILAWLAAGSALLAAVTGYVLSREDGYSSEAVTRHLQLGLALAAASVVTAVLRTRRGAATAKGGASLTYRIALLVTLGIMLPAGHIGASITHGEGFLTEPLSTKRPSSARPDGTIPTQPSQLTPTTPTPDGSTPPESTPPESAPTESAPLKSNPPATSTVSPATYESAVAPLFASRCTSCHGETKTKADLALHTREAILKGGESGPIVPPGKPRESEMLRRLRLPVVDRDHMPPENKPQLSAAEIDLLTGWILAGAPLEGAFDASSPPPPSASRTDSTRKPESNGATSSVPSLPDAAPTHAPPPAPDRAPPPPAVPAPAPPPDAIEALRARLVHVEAVAAESNELLIDFAAVAPQMTDADVQLLLAPLKPNVANLSLGRSIITDASMELVAAMPNLLRLDVRRTMITDAGVARLAGLARLEELTLAQNQLSDAAVDSLLAMPALKRLYIWRSGLSADAAARLRRERPALTVDNGDAPDSTPTDAEQVVQLGKTPPAAGPAAAESLKPVNANCPVTGKPVDPRYVIVFEGKAIGFCCPNCPGQFWAEPGKYEVKP